jgi:hypothetical protein
MTSAVYLLAALALLLRAVFGVNQMTRATCHTIRAVMVAMLVAGVAAVISPLYGYKPTWVDAGVLAAVAAYVWRDRRRVVGG